MRCLGPMRNVRDGAVADRERVVASETQRLLSCTTAMAMGQPLRTKYSDALDVLPATLDSVGFALPLGFAPPATDARAPDRGSLQGAGGMFFAAGQPGAGGGRPVLQRPQSTEGGFPPLQRADARADAVRYGIGWERSTALARASAATCAARASAAASRCPAASTRQASASSCSPTICRANSSL